MPDKILMGRYRRIFHTDDGMEVLADFLDRLHWFDELGEDPEIIARHNVAVELLKILGIYKEINKKLLVRELFNKSQLGTE